MCSDDATTARLQLTDGICVYPATIISSSSSSSSSTVSTSTIIGSGGDGPKRVNTTFTAGTVQYTMTGTVNTDKSFAFVQLGTDGSSTSYSTAFSYLATTKPTSTSSSAGTMEPSSSSAPASGNRVTSTSSSSEPSSNGLSSGAKAGIAIGVVAAVALLASLFFFLRRRRSRRSSPATGSEMAYVDNGTHPSASDLRAEKDLNVVSASARTNSYKLVDGNGETQGRHGNGSRHIGQRRFDEYADEEGHQSAPPAAVVPPRKPLVGSQSVAASTSSGSVEGMSAEERARWDEEEARLDEAIAEAERRGGITTH